MMFGRVEARATATGSVGVPLGPPLVMLTVGSLVVSEPAPGAEPNGAHPMGS